MKIHEILDRLQKLSRDQMSAEQHNRALLDLTSSLTCLESNWQAQAKTLRRLWIWTAATTVMLLVSLSWLACQTRQLAQLQTRCLQQQKRLDFHEETLVKIANWIKAEGRK